METVAMIQVRLMAEPLMLVDGVISLQDLDYQDTEEQGGQGK